MAKKLGVYIGNEKIHLVEVHGRQIKKHISVPLLFNPAASAVSDNPQDGLSGVAGDNVKQVAALQTALRENKIEAKSAVVGLTSKDLFVRGFQMPTLNRSEIDVGIRFEARKYIPFSAGDLTFDYQYRELRRLGKINVLFTAVMKNNLEKYTGILTQAGLQIDAVEPTNFTLFRLFGITGQLKQNASCAVVALQNLEGELAIFIEGFPCYSRDIKLSAPQNQNTPVNSIYPTEEANIQMRLLSEIKVSLDYFRRQFTGCSVAKVLIISKETSADLITNLSKGLNLPVELVGLANLNKIAALVDLGDLKAYSLALKNSIKIDLKIDLCRKRPADTSLKRDLAAAKPFVLNIRFLLKNLFVGAGLIILAYLFTADELNVAKKKLVSKKKEVKAALGDVFYKLDLTSLKNKNTEFSKKIKEITGLITGKRYMTSTLNALPSLMENSLWLDSMEITLSGPKKRVYIKGCVYLADKNAEVSLIKKVAAGMKSDGQFMEGLQNFTLTGITSAMKGEYPVTTFEIIGE